MLRAALALALAAAASAAKLRDIVKHDCRSKLTNKTTTFGVHVEDEYIAVMKRGVEATAHGLLAKNYAATKSWSIGNGAKSFRAFHAKLAAPRLAALLGEEGVDYVERNQIVHAIDEGLAGPHPRPTRQCPDEQTADVSWGQSRTTVRTAAEVGNFYRHSSRWGEGVDVYVLDTGIRITHEDFGGRAIWGATFAMGADQDNFGHGTHCASTIGGTRYGVAKAATLIAVKVLSDAGMGSLDNIISGIEWMVRETATRGRRGIGSMSLGAGYSAAINAAVDAAAGEGVLMSSAAGNCGNDACNYSPASAVDGICIGATALNGNSDSRASFSNHGVCVDTYAPGEAITAAGWGIPFFGADDSYASMSGTSMACPHASGVAAMVLSQHPAYTSAQVKQWIVDNAADNVAANVPKMLHVPC